MRDIRQEFSRLPRLRVPQRAIGVCAALGCVLTLAAGSDQQRVLQEDEIKDFTSGKTFHYLYRGTSRGEEQHDSDGRAIWRLPDGKCWHGVWVVKGPVLCYFYGLFQRGCWNVVEENGAYRHEPLGSDFKPVMGAPVHVDRISTEPVQCTPQSLT